MVAKRKKIGRNTLLVSLAVVGVVAVISSTLLYSFAFIKVRGIITQVANTSEEAQLLAKKNTHIQTVRRVVRDTQPEREKIDAYFLTDDEIVSFLEEVEGLGTHVGVEVTVQAVSVGKPIDKDERITPLNLVLKSEGSLEKIFYLLTLLEDFPKAMSVQEVQFSQQPDEGIWVGNFDIVVLKIEKAK